MKTIRFFIPLMLLGGVLWIHGCAEDEGDDTPPPCIEGTWLNDVSCYGTVKYVFNSDGTGKVWENNCANQLIYDCPDGAEWREGRHFTYEATNSGLTLSYTAILLCDTMYNANASGTITDGDYICDGEIMTLGPNPADTYFRQ